MLNFKNILSALVISAIGLCAFWFSRAAAIDQAPKDVMAGIQARIVGGSGGWNACMHNRQFGPVYGGAARANPDSVVSIMAYDVSEGPVLVSGETWPEYWSISLYEQNSDAFYVLNDRDLPSRDFRLVISDRSVDGLSSGDKFVESPTKRGIMLIRRYAKEAAVMPGIHANQDKLSCGLLREARGD